jgi:rubredoxin-NAD+ reductase
VQAVDPREHRVILDREPLDYARLVLAVGARPVPVPVHGDAVADIFTINNLADYRSFREALASARHVTLIGGGLIGCEFANDLRRGGFEVTVIDPADCPLSRLVPPELGRAVERALGRIGIEWRLGESVESVSAAGKGYRLHLSGGAEKTTDLVLSAIGLAPVTDLAEGGGLNVQTGIVTDRHLRTSDPDVFALGDCAEVEGLVLPYVLPITHAARALGSTLAGKDTGLKYPAMPVTVKTPDLPLVAASPLGTMPGEWDIEETGSGVRALFRDGDGNLRGFALAGDRTGEQHRWVKELPPWLEG